MKIKSLHQDNHTKKKICYGIHKNIWKNIGEKTILYYHFLNTYTEYFINGILQHCKHIVRLNVHVWFLRSLSGFSHRFSSFECDFRSVYMARGVLFLFFLGLTLSFPGMKHTVQFFLQQGIWIFFIFFLFCTHASTCVSKLTAALPASPHPPSIIISLLSCPNISK